MPKAAAALDKFKVRKASAAVKPAEEKGPVKLITKGFRVLPDAAHQFETLRAELGKEHPKDMGPKLIADALNLLFRKHGKPPIA
jgi:hypothetical protein